MCEEPAQESREKPSQGFILFFSKECVVDFRTGTGCLRLCGFQIFLDVRKPDLPVSASSENRAHERPRGHLRGAPFFLGTFQGPNMLSHYATAWVLPISERYYVPHSQSTPQCLSLSLLQVYKNNIVKTLQFINFPLLAPVNTLINHGSLILLKMCSLAFIF